MNFPRVVVGYHGCLEPLASDLLTGRRSVEDWPVSKNEWDWLGDGIYFWEHGPSRARRWAEDQAARSRSKGKTAVPAVVGAIILLGNDVLDLTDVRFTEMLGQAHRVLAAQYAAAGSQLPGNEKSERKRHHLDCLVINSLLSDPGLREQYSIVRGAFEEGDPAFPEALIRRETHIQLAVRRPGVICGLFKPRGEP
jgi:hypothetical protein